MQALFDIAEDELQVFLSEADDHLQLLDEGLVQLERRGGDPELLQAIFRAAHTLKGSAGVIGHRRMAEVTHALETVLDGLRKQTLAVSAPLVDACLEALDALKLLRNEVAEGETTPVEIAPLVERLSTMGRSVSAPAGTPLSLPEPAPAVEPVNHDRTNGRKKNRQASHRSNPPLSTSPPSTALPVAADIAPDSAASAARAFQVLMALQALGEVRDLQPPQSAIETAAPVRRLSARLVTVHPVDDVRKALAGISEIERVEIGGETFELAGPGASRIPSRPPGSGQPAAPLPIAPTPEDAALPLGEYLVVSGQVTREQLEAALHRQGVETGPSLPLGRILMKLGFMSQAALDRAMAAHQQHVLAARQESLAGEGRARARADKTVRTSVERLDNLMNLVGELITDRNRLNQIRANFEARFRGEAQVENLAQTVIHVGRITDQLQEEVMRIRMLPIANVFNKHPRLVRDLARKAGKQAELVIRGEDTELDRSVIEEIGDPLIHLLRNAMDHGLEAPEERRAAGKVERGTILLTARHAEGRILLTVEDDGRGIDVQQVKASAVQRGLIGEAEAAALGDEEAVDLIFRSGLSTAKVVSDISGRGVGMDIVRANIERLNGQVQVESWPGRGTRFQIVLPLTLAIIPAMLVDVGPGTFAIPLNAVMEALRLPAADIRTVNGRPVTLLRGRLLPLLRLDAALGLAAQSNGRAAPRPAQIAGLREYVVAVRWGKLEMGLIVDALVGEQEVVVKSLGALIGETPGVSGAAILGDGSVALIVDVPKLFTCSLGVGRQARG